MGVDSSICTMLSGCRSNSLSNLYQNSTWGEAQHAKELDYRPKEASADLWYSYADLCISQFLFLWLIFRVLLVLLAFFECLGSVFPYLAMVRLAILAALLSTTFLSTVLTATAPTKCYHIDGSLAVTAYRCDNSTTGQSTCCEVGAVCYSNGVCQQSNNGVQDYLRVGCTDSTWKDPACLDQCATCKLSSRSPKHTF